MINWIRISFTRHLVHPVNPVEILLLLKVQPPYDSIGCVGDRIALPPRLRFALGIGKNSKFCLTDVL
jgi:hypothetical protein